MHKNAEDQRRYPGRQSPKTRNRSPSSRRRSRSPRRKKSMSPPAKRRAPAREKRPSTRSSREDGRPLKARPRSRSRSKTPPPRRLSRERRHSFTPTKDISPNKLRGTDTSERFRSGDKYLVERPLFRGPEKDILRDRDSLKKIVLNIRDNPPTSSDMIKRSIINPEDITIVRRAASGHREYHQGDAIGYGRLPPPPLPGKLAPPSSWLNGADSYGRYASAIYDYDSQQQYNTREGSRPIFERDEIMKHRRKIDDDDRERKRGGSASPGRSGRRHGDPTGSGESFRSRDAYYEDERHRSGRDYPGVRPVLREHESRTYKDRGEDRYPSGRSRSYERSREYLHERKDRYEERDGHHRSLRRSSVERSRPDDRRLRRAHPSPTSHYDEYRAAGERRERSLEPPHYRDHEFPPSDRYSSDYLANSQGYYEGDGRELPSPGRGRGRALAYRGRGAPFARPGAAIIRPGAQVRPVRGGFLPRAPGAVGRRMPFPPPRVIRPIIRPVIPFIAPFIPVRPPPAIPVRPPPVISVRHSVVPLPF